MKLNGGGGTKLLGRNDKGVKVRGEMITKGVDRSVGMMGVIVHAGHHGGAVSGRCMMVGLRFDSVNGFVLVALGR